MRKSGRFLNVHKEQTKAGQNNKTQPLYSVLNHVHHSVTESQPCVLSPLPSTWYHAPGAVGEKQKFSTEVLRFCRLAWKTPCVKSWFPSQPLRKVSWSQDISSWKKAWALFILLRLPPSPSLVLLFSTLQDSCLHSPLMVSLLASSN